MVTQPNVPYPESRGQSRPHSWPLHAVLSGFMATILLSAVVALAYLFAVTQGDQTGGTIARWLYALAHNPLAERTTEQLFAALGVNLIIGLAIALAYAALIEPRLGGPGWLRGLLFAAIPFLVSITIFFPLMGIGFLGIGAGAGPLPVLGNFIAHLAYGITLGAVYAIPFANWLDNTETERRSAARAERGAGIGVLAGLPIGALIGFLISPTLADLAGTTAIVLAGALVGGGFGILVGSLMGIGDPERPDAPTLNSGQ